MQRLIRLIALNALLVVTGCIQEMSDQPRYEPLETSTVFDDGMASRPPVAGTVARGQLQLDKPLFTGRSNGQFVAELPAALLERQSLEQLLSRGRERYSVFCSHCHGEVGGGIGGPPMYEPLVGLVVQRGFPSPPTYHQDRLRSAPIGHFFDVITKGIGRMPPHGYMIPPHDRWAIATYVRALQLSQYAPADVLAPNELSRLSGTTGIDQN